MTNLYIYFLFAAMAIEFLFALWANHRAQSVLDAFIAHPRLYEAAGRSSDTYFVRKLAIAMLRLEIGRGALIVGLLVWHFCSIRFN